MKLTLGILIGLIVGSLVGGFLGLIIGHSFQRQLIYDGMCGYDNILEITNQIERNAVCDYLGSR